MSSKNEFKVFEWKDWLAGWIAGAGGTVVGQPFDTVKVRMTQEKGKASIMKITSNMIKNEGPQSLFKGTLSPVVGYGVMNGLAFAAYQISNRYFCQKGNFKSADELPIKYLFYSGFLGGCVCDLITIPSELIKIQLQVKKGSSNVGNKEVINYIFKNGGIKGFYRGTMATLLRDGPAWAGYFGIYEWLKRRWIKPDWKDTELRYKLAILNAGGLGGVASWVVNYPVDLIKTRLQAQPFKQGEAGYGEFNGFIDCARKIYRAEGIKAFYKGFLPCIIRGFPVNAAVFLLYELGIKRLTSMEDKWKQSRL